ncbi:MAG TPA: ROK family protein, partial [Tepidisphaeraceae bacterium]|nr:ROK family protein [Tepidisphaeraceae bacterium]
RDRLQALLGLDVEIQNDANAAALGEFLVGPSKGINNLILLTLGTGVGGGVVADGHLLQGADNAAGELGHVKVEFTNGHPCACGKSGCLEAYAGAAGIGRIAGELMQKKTGYLGSSHFDTHALADAANAGDPAAQKTFFIVGQYLGRAIANLIDTFNPEKVVIGGGASATMELLRPGIMQAVDEYASFPETLSRVQIERSAFPDDINVIGAAATWLNAHRIPVPHSK